MAKYRKKPVVIEAEVFDPVAQPLPFRDRGICCFDGRRQEGHQWFIATLEGDMTLTPGDFVIKGIKGEFYPCKPDIFHATYEAADGD